MSTIWLSREFAEVPEKLTGTAELDTVTQDLYGAILVWGQLCVRADEKKIQEKMTDLWLTEISPRVSLLSTTIADQWRAE